MTEKGQNIISPKLFFGFCLTELLMLITPKILQAILLTELKSNIAYTKNHSLSIKDSEWFF